ncbi:MAG: DUF7408 domain-containing protein [Aggregatilineales bacterium]
MSLRRICLSLLLSLIFFVTMGSAQTGNVALQVEAAFDNFYRPGQWLPVRVDVQNDGADLTGRLTVRPESSDRAVSNAYSTLVDLPSGSAKTVFLHIQVREFPSFITVELLTDDNVRVIQERIALTPIDPRDDLHIVIREGDAGNLNLNALHTANFAAFQANWSGENIPDNATALQAVDTIWLNGVDSEAFTVTQIQTLEDHVLRGGHLIVFGGLSWEQTASRLSDLLPLVPSGTASIDDVTPLARFAGDVRASLTGDTLVTTGELRDDARVLVETTDGLPLISRHDYGAGTVDYVGLDPALNPLQDWQRVSDLWLQIVATVDPQPAWTMGFIDAQQTAAALATLPGIDLLPPVSSMLLYLFAYIFLIGPVNYFILSRINRRGFAWVTIPLLIAIFTGLAWTVGFNLRGNDVILHRLNIVQTWEDNDDAYLQQLISVLAPRRDSFTLSVPDERFLRVIPGLQSSSVLSGALEQSTAEIVQRSGFAAEDFTVDGGIFSNFNATGTIPKPDIGGTVTMVYNPTTGTQALQGIIRNDSDFTLEAPILLARNLALPLDNIAAGDSLSLNTSDTVMESLEDVVPAAAPISYSYEQIISIRDTRSYRANILRTRTDILNPPEEELLPGSLESDIQERRRALLTAFTRDQFSSTARGHDVYLAGWSDVWTDDDVTFDEKGTQNLTTTLYLIRLDVTIEQPDDVVTIQPDQFTLFWLNAESTIGTVPDDLTMEQLSSTEMQFVPIDGAILDDVTGMQIRVDRGSSYGRQFELLLWNYPLQQWMPLEDTRREEYILTDPTPYLGVNNSVRMRFEMDIPFGSAWVRHVGVLQTGTFKE